MCRSRRELSNEYLLAKIGVDTAENEPLEVWEKIIHYYSFVSLLWMRVTSLAERELESCFGGAWKAWYPKKEQKKSDINGCGALRTQQLALGRVEWENGRIGPFGSLKLGRRGRKRKNLQRRRELRIRPASPPSRSLSALAIPAETSAKMRYVSIKCSRLRRRIKK